MSNEMADEAKAAEQRRAPRREGHGPAVGTGEKAKDFGGSLRRLVRQLRPERTRLVVAVVMGVASVVMAVLGPKILGRATDLILAGVIGKQMPPGATKEQVVEQTVAEGNQQLADMLRNLDFTPGEGINFGAVGTVLWVVLCLYVAAALAQWVQGYVLNDAVNRSIHRMRHQVSAKLDRLPLAYFDRQPRGELLSRVTNDIDNVSQTLQQTLSQFLNSLLTLLGVMVMMIAISWQLALVALLSIPVAMVLVGVIGTRSQKLFAAQWKATGELNATIEESYTGQTLVKVFGRQKEVQAEFDARNQSLFRSSFGAQFVSGIMMPVMFLVGNLNYVVVAVMGGLKVASGQLNIGDVQAFIQYSRQFTQPLTQVASMANVLQSGLASAERVFDIQDAEEMSPETSGTLPTPLRGEVRFEDVTFSYTPDKPLIEGLDLTARPGQTVAIVGPTGAGKTTLVNLLMRFYDLNSGRITLDGVDIASVPRQEVRRHFGMVLQDTWLFGGTIRDNIAYGRPEATEEEIVAAARAAFVDRFVHALPAGYDTVIDEEGGGVSAGERQLITIARAFLAEPALLILDEATSSVDTRTELLLQQAMANLRSGRTSFVIAHRLSTIRDADLILVMRDGAIVEQGSHSELLQARGAYHDLYQAQFSGT